MQTKIIAKRNGKTRTIFMPSEAEKAALRAMLPEIEAQAARLDVSGVCHGFTRGRSPVTNAQAHVGWRLTLTMDLADFFDSVTPSMCAIGRFRNGVPHDMSICFVDGAARQGLPTSPALANIAASPIDRDICALISKGRFTKPSFVYTRYADDLCFSFDNPSVADMLRTQVKAIVERHGFKVNDSKTRMQAAVAGVRMVTGVGVTDTGIVTPRHIKRRIRAGEHQMRSGIRPRHLRTLLSKIRETRRHGGNSSLSGMMMAGVRGLREWARLRLPKAAAAPAAPAQRPFPIHTRAESGEQTHNPVTRMFGWAARKLIR